MPRDILIHIARLRSEEEMVTAYQEFKNGKLSREELKAKARKSRDHIRQRKPKPARLIRGFSKDFGKIDITSLNEHERNRLSNEVEKLVESLLTALDVLRAGSPDDPHDNPAMVFFDGIQGNNLQAETVAGIEEVRKPSLPRRMT